MSCRVYGHVHCDVYEKGYYDIADDVMRHGR